MKKAVVTIVAIVALGWGIALGNDVRDVALSSSVSVGADIPVLKVYFAEPIEEDKKPILEEIREQISKEIAEAIKAERKEQEKDKYSSYLTNVERWGVSPVSREAIPLGIICPEDAKYPTNILAVYKTKKTDIKAWEKDYEKDVLTVSETVNVSPKEAEKLINRLSAAGYTINKQEADKDAPVKLLWFKEWTDTRPEELNWEVTVEGSDESILIGYDPRGILLVKPIPENTDGKLKRVHVKAGYFDLAEKPKAKELIDLEQKYKDLEEKYKEDTKKKAEPKEKRDIQKATFFDVMIGKVKLERFWVRTAASGVFIGSTTVKEEQTAWLGSGVQAVYNKRKSMVLTNAHVAEMGMPGKLEVYISKDKEKMWLVFQGYMNVRYNPDSDMYGTPAQILAIDDGLVYAWDFDCAVLATSVVPQYEQYRAILGDSDKVKVGDKVLVAGNPMLMQGYLTSGIISKINYSILDSILSDSWLGEGISRGEYNWCKHSNIWYDATIGIGGTSGSGVTAASGSEEGKLIALHNMGMVSRYSLAGDPNKELKGVEFDPGTLSSNPTADQKIIDLLRGKRDEVFKDYPYRTAKHSINLKELSDDAFESAMRRTMHAHEVSGMNGAIPINLIAAYLQERGIDTRKLGWKGLGDVHWMK